MSNDISTMYAREKNMKDGRKGYYLWKQVKTDGLSPKEYGGFVTAHRGRRNNGKRC